MSDKIIQASGLAGTPLEMMMKYNMDTGALRPWHDGKGNNFITVNTAAGEIDVPVANAVLRKEEWIEFDTDVIKAVRVKLMGVAMLMRRGLRKTLNSGLGRTILEYDRSSDLDDADQSMSGVKKSDNSRQEFDTVGLPLFITHKDFQIAARTLAVSRNMGDPLDTSQAESAGYRVGEAIENALYVGSAIKVGGYLAYGLTTDPDRNTGSLTADWDASGSTGVTILADVLAMIQDAIDAGYYGPYALHLPVAYMTVLEGDFSAVKGDGTIRERLMRIVTLEEIVTSSKVPANNVILHQLSTEAIRIVDALPPQVLRWDTDGGMMVNMKAMAIMVPDVRSDITGASGIVHYT